MDLYASGSCGLRTLLTGLRAPAVRGVATVDLRRVTFCDASMLVGLAAFAEGAAEDGLRVQVSGPSRPNVARYLARMRLGEVLDDLGADHDLPVVVGTPRDNLMELQRFDGRQGANNLATTVHRLVSPASREGAQAMASGLGESGENVIEHSGRLGGFTACQQYPFDGRLVFAVADSGRGMYATMSSQAGVVDHASATRRALTPGATTSGDVARGNGLPDIVREVIALKGRLDIVSGDALVAATAGGIGGSLRGLHDFQGTVVRGNLRARA